VSGIVGRTYYERDQPVVVLIQWGSGGGPRNVLIERADGSTIVRPFRGLRRNPSTHERGRSTMLDEQDPELLDALTAVCELEDRDPRPALVDLERQLAAVRGRDVDLAAAGKTVREIRWTPLPPRAPRRVRAHGERERASVYQTASRFPALVPSPGASRARAQEKGRGCALLPAVRFVSTLSTPVGARGVARLGSTGDQLLTA
jgi:acetyl esterase